MDQGAKRERDDADDEKEKLWKKQAIDIMDTYSHDASLLFYDICIPMVVEKALNMGGFAVRPGYTDLHNDTTLTRENMEPNMSVLRQQILSMSTGNTPTPQALGCKIAKIWSPTMERFMTASTSMEKLEALAEWGGHDPDEFARLVYDIYEAVYTVKHKGIACTLPPSLRLMRFAEYDFSLEFDESFHMTWPDKIMNWYKYIQNNASEMTSIGAVSDSPRLR